MKKILVIGAKTRRKSRTCWEWRILNEGRIFPRALLERSSGKFLIARSTTSSARIERCTRLNERERKKGGEGNRFSSGKMVSSMAFN